METEPAHPRRPAALGWLCRPGADGASAPHGDRVRGDEEGGRRSTDPVCRKRIDGPGAARLRRLRVDRAAAVRGPQGPITALRLTGPPRPGGGAARARRRCRSRGLGRGSTAATKLLQNDGRRPRASWPHPRVEVAVAARVSKRSAQRVGAIAGLVDFRVAGRDQLRGGRRAAIDGAPRVLAERACRLMVPKRSR